MQPKSHARRDYVAFVVFCLVAGCADAPKPELKPLQFSLYSGRYRRAWQGSDLRVTTADSGDITCLSLDETCSISNSANDITLAEKTCAVTTDANAERYVINLLCLETDDAMTDCETTYGDQGLIGTLELLREHFQKNFPGGIVKRAMRYIMVAGYK